MEEEYFEVDYGTGKFLIQYDDTSVTRIESPLGDYIDIVSYEELAKLRELIDKVLVDANARIR